MNKKYSNKMTSKDKNGNILINGEFKICNIPAKCSGLACDKLCTINQIIKRLYEFEHGEVAVVKGDKCWIIENCNKVTSAEIVSFSGNLVLIKTQDGNALRLPRHRLYDTEEKAQKVLQEYRPIQKKQTPYDYMQ